MYVLNFGTVGEQILVKKKDPPVCPEFWYGLRTNSGEKKQTPSVVTVGLGCCAAENDNILFFFLAKLSITEQKLETPVRISIRSGMQMV